MKLKPLVLAAGLALAASGSFADDGASGAWTLLAGGDWVSQFGSVTIGGTPLNGGDDLISFAAPPVGGPFNYKFTLSMQDIVLSPGPTSYVDANGAQTGITVVTPAAGYSFGYTDSLGASPAFSVYLAGTAGTNASYSGELRITPVPEPETYALMLAGLGVIGFVATRRKVG